MLRTVPNVQLLVKIAFGVYTSAALVMVVAETADRARRRRRGRPISTASEFGPAHAYRTHSHLRSSPGRPTRTHCSRRSPHLSGGFPT